MGSYEIICVQLVKIVRKKESEVLSCVQLFATLWTVACTRLLRPWDFLGKSTGVGCHFLLQKRHCSNYVSQEFVEFHPISCCVE